MLPSYILYLTIPISLYGVFFYIRDTIRGTTKPNRVTWILWTIAPLVGVYISYRNGVAFPLLLSTCMAGFSPLLVVIASYANKKSYWKTTDFDYICGALSLCAIVLWITTHNAVLSLAAAIVADACAGIPTVIKAWNASTTETVSPYLYGMVNQVLTFLAITQFSFTNTSFPLYFILINSLIIWGIVRKKKY
jgi:hypothetical protein